MRRACLRFLSPSPPSFPPSLSFSSDGDVSAAGIMKLFLKYFGKLILTIICQLFFKRPFQPETIDTFLHSQIFFEKPLVAP